MSLLRAATSVAVTLIVAVELAFLARTLRDLWMGKRSYGGVRLASRLEN